MSEEANDVGVVEGCHGFGFALEPLTVLLLTCKLAIKDLDGDIMTFDWIMCQIDPARSATTEAALDLIAPDARRRILGRSH